MKWVRWLWLLLLVPLVIGLGRLRFDVDVLNLLPADLPAVQGLRLYQDHFANARELVITLGAPTAEMAEEAARALGNCLAGQTQLVASVAWQAPWERPDQSSELIAWLWLNQPPAAIEALRRRLSPAELPWLLETARERLAMSMSAAEIARTSYDPLGLTELPSPEVQPGSMTPPAGAGLLAPPGGDNQDLFASADGRFRLIYVEAAQELRDYRQSALWLEQVRFAVQTCRGTARVPPEVTLQYTGRPAFLAEIATGMERDMSRSVLGTTLIITILFLVAHRRLLPLLWLVTLLTGILLATLACGGLFLGTLNVVSAGFAAILLGLAADYGLVLYQEARSHPAAPAATIRRMLAPSIGWAAATTAGAFAVLNLSGLPGLAQLGSLVAMGLVLAALVLLTVFLPPLRRAGAAGGPESGNQSLVTSAATRGDASVPPNRWLVAGLTATALGVPLIILSQGLPRLDHTAEPLRPARSPAYAAMDELKARLGREREPLWLLISAETVAGMADRLNSIDAALQQAAGAGYVTGYNLPRSLWPDPERQTTNRTVLRELAAEVDRIRAAAQGAGFTSASLALAEPIFSAWRQLPEGGAVVWPRNPVSRWILDRFSFRGEDRFLVLGLVDAPADPARALAYLRAQLPAENVRVSSWELLGEDLLGVIRQDFWRVMLPMGVLVGCALWLTFRGWREIVVSLGVLVSSGLALWAVMSLAGWSWNLLNLMALPLLLGAGVDYSIHLQLSLRRNHGDRSAARRTTGRALLLCGATTVAGFGSLAGSGNAGLASLGQVCATGIACVLLVSLVLLPLWWGRLCSATSSPRCGPGRVRRPSRFYRAEVWRLGVALGPFLSRPLGHALCRFAADAYWRLAPRRREVVIANLGPVVGDPDEARRISRSLFRHFARKLADLWLLESGRPVTQLFAGFHGWERFLEAQGRGRGVILLTAHIGNWELGGPMLTREGVKLQVLTAAEPGSDFTQLRQISRERWGIETRVVGANWYDVVELIKQLNAGATLALLVDRPQPSSAALVKLCGRPFAASLAPAELARASGAALLPVCVVHTPRGYEAHVLPELQYHRRKLADRAQRHALTQEMMAAFESVIRQYPDQWYHFVPIWPDPDELEFPATDRPGSPV